MQTRARAFFEFFLAITHIDPTVHHRLLLTTPSGAVSCCFRPSLSTRVAHHNALTSSRLAGVFCLCLA
eukprot:5778010-Pleurochrysis_carterae.AAC.4